MTWISIIETQGLDLESLRVFFCPDVTAWVRVNQTLTQCQTVSAVLFILVIPLMTWISIIETQVTRRTSNLMPNHKPCTETQVLHISCRICTSTNLNHKSCTETEVISSNGKPSPPAPLNHS
jgi:hypothetical protein